MQKIYFFVQLAFCFCTVFPHFSNGQNCATLTATYLTYESRCAATGSIKILASGGSGSYQYKVTGPVNSNFTSSDSITGLSPGIYAVSVNDLVSNCTFTQNNLIVSGNYNDPRFTLDGINVSCDNGNNGSIIVNGQQFGRYPFAYTIVAPSPMGIGITNQTGVFTNLIAGDYRIRMTDSCGGIQTRSITINNYTWWIDSKSFTKISCDSATGFIRVIDSRGNVSTVGAIPGFMYGIVRFPGDTIWSPGSSFTFDLAGASSIGIVARDSCGTIKKSTASVVFSPSVGANVSISNQTCDLFSASLTNLTNFLNGDFCLYDSNGVQLSCNSSGSFNNIPYGNYCIEAHALCPDTIITRCFTVSPPPISVAGNLSIYNKDCTTFSAAVNGQVGLTNPTYCLFDSADVEIVCNSNGIFDALTYGSYCVKIEDNCRDTTIIRCISVFKPSPVVPAIITPSYIDCNNITVIVGSDSLFSPQYCLYDSTGVMITCNNTGIFNSLSFGNHCVSIYDACYDTTINRCFTVGTAVVADDLTAIFSNKQCSTFTITGNSNNLSGPQYCLYTQDDTLISCNTTGIFNDISYGAYCLKVNSDCPDTLFTNCFVVAPPIPSVKSTVTISNKTCTTFTARITNQQNLTSPQYCIFDNNNVQIACNTSGLFGNLDYGSYCIKIKDSCYDTTITRCFSSLPKPVNLSVTPGKSCAYGYTTFGITVSGGSLPVNIKVFRPDKSLFFNMDYNTNSINIDSIPGTSLGETYKVIVTDDCGNQDSVSIGATASIVTHSATVFPQCPSAKWGNGSGKIQLTTSNNLGVFTVRIIRKDGVNISPHLSPDSAAGGVYTFNDLGTGTYVISYKLNDLCNRTLYDTVTIGPYVYPNLSRSSAYQCDVSGFSIGAVASNGVGPFSYEIIGSSPSIPSINTGPQASPLFNINNGTNYTLIRLRALDACGNATLGDASILPLSNYSIKVDSNCFQSSSTLSIDTFYNSTYSWYKKENYNSVDSTYLGGGYNVYIPFLSANDTGTYICHVVVNSGCIKRSYIYNLTGLCYVILPTATSSFSGSLLKNEVLLNWKSMNEGNLKSYIVERKNKQSLFAEIGRITPGDSPPHPTNYTFIDTKPETGNNFYRLKLLFNNSSFAYSNVILLNKISNNRTIHCYPNPVSDILTIDFKSSVRHIYKVSLVNLQNQGLWETIFISGNNKLLQIPRPKSISRGIYRIQCKNLNTNENFSELIIFL